MSRRAFTPDPFTLMKVQTEAMMMAWEASTVIWMRSLGMMGFWSVAPSENARMISEKQSAFAKAASAAFWGPVSGKNHAATAAATLRPLRRKTKSNQRRLARRGPAKG